ncbi:hypothetical protein MPRG_11960 [Mycobacterium paragordonae]|uniref:DUF1214 domain-containing protein n=1 Tax=Mycobacterium paragordonae TaxID=1389713 RepID=A0ABQ1C0G1_9MYCO|nr:hypothetical protein MPRG_11960 [Mycobacterium paragordonae]
MTATAEYGTIRFRKHLVPQFPLGRHGRHSEGKAGVATDHNGVSDRPEVAAWNGFVDSLHKAGQQLAANTAELSRTEQADAFRALLRSVNNQLGRLEVDRERPELLPFNRWRQKFLMDNPDFLYWVADINAAVQYRIRGNRGGAAYVSITVYTAAGNGLESSAIARLDSDEIAFNELGDYDVTLGGNRPADGDWIELPDGAITLWVRHFHNDMHHDRAGWCDIEPVHAPQIPAPIDPERFCRQLTRAAKAAALMPHIWKAATAEDLEQVNQLRHWHEMSGGATYTEPGIHYLRGGWQLSPGEALLIEGELVDCRYWNILAYSRFLNSLDHRYRHVSYTGATATVTGQRYRFIVAGTDPGLADADWIDTEQRPFGILVMRFLQPVQTPRLPSVRRILLTDLGRNP